MNDDEELCNGPSDELSIGVTESIPKNKQIHQNLNVLDDAIEPETPVLRYH